MRHNGTDVLGHVPASAVKHTIARLREGLNRAYTASCSAAASESELASARTRGVVSESVATVIVSPPR